MQGDIEGQPLIGPTQQFRYQDQVGGTGDGQEFSESLNQGQHNDVQSFHR